MPLESPTAVPVDRHFVFSDRWLAEAIRLDLAGSRSQISAMTSQQQLDAERVARQLQGSPEQRVLSWAAILAQSIGLEEALHTWRQRSALMLMVMCILAFAGGLSASIGIMGAGNAPVNVLWALGALLGFNLLMLFFWGISLGMAPGELSLGNAWFWLSTRLAGKRTTLLARSFAGLSARIGLGRWWMAAVTHSIWSSAAAGAFCGLLLALSLRSYVFVWETTILPASLFNSLVQGIGWLPAQLGFSVPADSVVTAAGVVNSDWASQPALERRAWAGWLCGALLVYGLLPRLVLLMFSAFKLSGGMKKFRLDLHHADWRALSARLSPADDRVGVIDPEQPVESSRPRAGQRCSTADGDAVVIAFELNDQIDWPAQFSHFHHERVANRQERLHALSVLDQSPPRALLLVCDAAQTVDRGSLAWLSEASGRALQVAVLLAGHGSDSRRQLWRQQLQTLGILPSSVFDQDADARLWLESNA